MTTTPSTGGTESLTAAALRLAQTRRSLMTLLASDVGRLLVEDQMGIPHELMSPANNRFADIITEAEIENLRTAELFLADADMCALIDVAAPTMPDQVLRPDDPIQPSGLIGFHTPLQDRTGTGVPLHIHGLSWQVIPAGHPLLNAKDSGVGDSVMILAFVSHAEMAEIQGGDPVPGLSRWMPNASVMWTIGTEIGHAYGRDPNTGEALSPTGEPFTPGFYQRLAAAFWTLAKQPRLVSTEDRAEPARKDRARYRRAGIERPEEPVRLVRMARRPERATGGGSRPVDWQHQWIVSGHWKNAWLPSQQTHRQVYVLPFVKGPADKPFIGGEKVFLATGRDLPEPPSST